MPQKLKSLPVYIVLVLAMGLALGLGFGSSPRAFAVASTTEFACQDGTAGVTKKTSGNAVVVTCASGSLIDYINYANDGVQPVAVKVTCPGTQQVDPEVDTPNQPTSKYTFYCVTVTGTGDNQTSTKSKTAPTVTDTPPPDVRCSDGSAAKDNNVQNCPVLSTADPAATSGNCSNVNSCDLINHYVQPFVNFLAAFMGVASVISLIVGGIQYGQSGGDSAKVTAAKNRIRNTIIALVMFLFLYTLLNFLVPGGLL